MTLTPLKAPSHCFICGSQYSGGHVLPGEKMKDGLRIFFGCGASMSVKILVPSVYSILFKNCGSEYDAIPYLMVNARKRLK